MITTLIPHIGVVVLASPMEVGANRAEQAAADLGRVLESTGCRVVNGGAVKNADQAQTAGRIFAENHVSCVALAPASWFEDYLVLDLLEECNVPVLFWALPGMETGALCGTQQVTCYLKQLEKPYQAVFGEIRAGEQLDRCMSFLRAAALGYSLRRAKIGMAGQRVRGMTEVAANEIALKKTFGCRVVPVDMVGLLRAACETGVDDRKRVWENVKRNAAHSAVSDEAGLESAGMYLAIKKVVNEEGLSALAFGCYPDFMGFACLAASLLADEGVPVACEGDINGAVGMLILQALTGQPTHNTDWLDPLPDGSVVFTHCGSSSYSLAENKKDITLAKVRLANQGVCSLFPAKPGPVTLVSLLPKGDGYQMAVLEGEALHTDMVFPGNPLRVKFSSPVKDVIDPSSPVQPSQPEALLRRSRQSPVASHREERRSWLPPSPLGLWRTSRRVPQISSLRSQELCYGGVGCPTALDLRSPFGEVGCQGVLHWIFAEGIGHHWIAGYGHVGREIKDLSAIIGKDLRLTAENL